MKLSVKFSKRLQTCFHVPSYFHKQRYSGAGSVDDPGGFRRGVMYRLWIRPLRLAVTLDCTRPMDTTIYGRDQTIHRTTGVNVEVNKKGQVVSVWFRCRPLPFTQCVVQVARARDMVKMYQGGEMGRIVAIEFVEDKQKCDPKF